jgi:hypothetical protein
MGTVATDLEETKDKLDALCQQVDDVDRQGEEQLHKIEQKMQKLTEKIDWKATTRKNFTPAGVKPYSITFRRGRIFDLAQLSIYRRFGLIIKALTLNKMSPDTMTIVKPHADSGNVSISAARRWGKFTGGALTYVHDGSTYETLEQWDMTPGHLKHFVTEVLTGERYSAIGYQLPPKGTYLTMSFADEDLVLPADAIADEEAPAAASSSGALAGVPPAITGPEPLREVHDAIRAVALRPAASYKPLVNPNQIKMVGAEPEDDAILKSYLEPWRSKIVPGSYKVALPGHKLHNVLDELFRQGETTIIGNVYVHYKPTSRPGAYKEHDDNISPLRRILVNADTTWRISNWYNHLGTPEAARQATPIRASPDWMIVLTARPRSELDDAFETDNQVSPAVERSLSLPHVMRVLIHGDREAKVSTILQIHQKNWHTGVDEITEILEKAGIPHRTRALVSEAVKLCADCRRHARILATLRLRCAW